MKPGKLNRRGRVIVVVLLVASGILLALGWKLLWFLTDDAFISFRYVSNGILGHGYVWNPPPFRPVEGYTSFLWVVVLDVTWRLLGVAPPESSNYISLLFSFLTLVVASAMVLRIKPAERLRRFRLLFLGLVLLGVVTNRSFLTWSSSGLETAMFDFFVVAWVYCSVCVSPTGRWWPLQIAASSVLVYLTRPDGVLFVAASLLIMALLAQGDRLRPGVSRIASASPFLVMPAHFLWRKHTYGDWLPNTFHAKIAGPWPASGVRYALSFILEYAVWVWLVLLLCVAITVVRRATRRSRDEGGASRGRRVVRVEVWVVAVTLLVHAAYYTFIVGGDHFEYRVYNHAIVLLFVSFVWLLNVARFPPAPSVALLVSFIILEAPVPWTHWSLTHNLDTRIETHKLRVGIAPHWPAAVRWYAGEFDRLQSWLIEHYVCVRHQEHKVNFEFLSSIFPDRNDGAQLPADGFPVFTFPAVGVASWVLPRINIIDLHGLNDYVIARNPHDPTKPRMMAHDRTAPPGYADCFAPNVELLPERRVVVEARQEALTAEAIRRCEREWTDRVK